MSEFQFSSERKDLGRTVDIIGPKVLPLQEKLLTQSFDGALYAYLTDDMFRRSGLPVAEMTEQEAIVDYYDFLTDVKTAAEKDQTKEGEDMLEQAMLFAEKTTYLSHEDFENAIQGLAAQHKEFLDRDDENNVIFFHRKQRSNNSQAYVSKNIMDALTSKFPDRVSIANEDTIDESLKEKNKSKTKIVVADDWSVTGNNISNDLANLLRLLHENETDNIEVNLIAIREDQKTAGFRELERLKEVYGVRQDIPVVGYFETPAIRTPMEGPSPTGSWSSVDYGFEQRLAVMADYLKRTGTSRNMPVLATIKPSYKNI